MRRSQKWGGGLDRVGNETTGSFFFPFAKFLSLSLSPLEKKTFLIPLGGGFCGPKFAQ